MPDATRLPKIPKGTRDFATEQMLVREKTFKTIGDVFKRHGAMPLDTPVFELSKTLKAKYGEDAKLIYDLADQGGELCSLRYDLRVPFARYIAMNGLSSFKRMAPDSEVVFILTELLDELELNNYKIKLNHRKLLDGMLDICGVPKEKFRTICSSIDKLDKQDFDQIRKEMVNEKGLSEEAADKIGSYVKKRGKPLELIAELKQCSSKFIENSDCKNALEDLDILCRALEKVGCIDKIVLDLSLARGLDYYTGVIFEAVYKESTEMGSIAAGGRYDDLIKSLGGKEVPAVGLSLGIERVLTIMDSKTRLVEVAKQKY